MSDVNQLLKRRRSCARSSAYASTARISWMLGTVLLLAAAVYPWRLAHSDEPPISRQPWIVGPGEVFSNIQDAVVSTNVLSGDIILVRCMWDVSGAVRPYVGQVSTKVATNDLMTNLPISSKTLYIRSHPSNSAPPELEFAPTVYSKDDSHATHVWLERGGELSGFTLRGPPASSFEEYHPVAAVGFAAKSLIARNTITNYTGIGVKAFCAANAYDVPSGVRDNIIAFNERGIVNGDVQHIHSGNVVMNNKWGIELISGNSAQVVNNLFIANERGVYAWSKHEAWATYPEIANNTFYSNVVGVFLEWVPPAMPMSAVIRDNIFYYNSGPAIDANTIYGPLICGEPPDRPALLSQQGGNYAQIRNNLFYHNNGSESIDMSNGLYAISNFWHIAVTNTFDDPELLQRVTNVSYVMHVPNPGGAPGVLGARMIECLFTNPNFMASPPWTGPHPWALATNSPCINRGSQNLRLGYTTTNSFGKPKMDSGDLDIGRHGPLSLEASLVIRRGETGAIVLGLQVPFELFEAERAPTILRASDVGGFVKPDEILEASNIWFEDWLPPAPGDRGFYTVLFSD